MDGEREREVKIDTRCFNVFGSLSKINITFIVAVHCRYPQSQWVDLEPWGSSDIRVAYNQSVFTIFVPIWHRTEKENDTWGHQSLGRVWSIIFRKAMAKNHLGLHVSVPFLALLGWLGLVFTSGFSICNEQKSRFASNASEPSAPRLWNRVETRRCEAAPGFAVIHQADAEASLRSGAPSRWRNKIVFP